MCVTDKIVCEVKMIKKSESKSKIFWKVLLESEKILSDKEAQELLDHTKRLRLEYGFRT